MAIRAVEKRNSVSEVKSSVLGAITARGGSKGIPRKNLALLAGKPMIRWTIEEAMQSCWLEKVVVSTDDREIAEMARTCGAEVPFIRPQELAEDDSSHMDVLLHLVNWLMIHDKYTPEYIVMLQPTSPSISINVFNCKKTLICRLLTEVMTAEFFEITGRKLVRCYWDACRLAPGTYSINLGLNKPGRKLDVLIDVGAIEVFPTDVYGTGKIDRKGGLIVPQGKWEFKSLSYDGQEDREIS